MIKIEIIKRKNQCDKKHVTKSLCKGPIEEVKPCRLENNSVSIIK